MVLKFAFEKVDSPILGTIWRPVAKVLFQRKLTGKWRAVWMIIDTGADYTLLPRFMAAKLEVDVEKECQIFLTTGIGGSEKVYFLPKMNVQVGKFKREIAVGFLDRNEVPPLLGRHLFLETLETYLASDHVTYFSDRPFGLEAK